MIIVEVKKGILNRDAIPQIMDYYGILKPQQQNSIIELFVVANTIPKERSAFLSEWGIKFIEIPVSKIVETAQKHSYEFSDVDRPEVLKKYQQLTHDINNEISARKSRVWIFQADPKRFDILNALSDENYIEDVWLVTRYKKDIRAGSIGIIWMSSRDAGIYAIADIRTNPNYSDEEPAIAEKYWIIGSDEANETKEKHKEELRVMV